MWAILVLISIYIALLYADVPATALFDFVFFWSWLVCSGIWRYSQKNIILHLLLVSSEWSTPTRNLHHLILSDIATLLEIEDRRSQLILWRMSLRPIRWIMILILKINILILKLSNLINMWWRRRWIILLVIMRIANGQQSLFSHLDTLALAFDVFQGLHCVYY